MPAALVLDLDVFASIADRVEHALTPALWQAIDVAGIAAERLDSARASWAQRVVGEQRACEFNRRFHEVCGAAGLPVGVRRAVERIARDEERHVELCDRISEAIGRPDEAWPQLGQQLPDPSTPSSVAELARWTVSMFCLGEVCAVGQLHALVDGQTDRGTRTALKFLLRDEAQHERFGWALASGLLPALDDTEREWLGAALAHSLGFYERVHADRPTAATEAPLVGHAGGVIDDATFSRAFYATVEGDILPRLAGLGVPAWEAWALRDEARALWDR